MFLDHRNTSLSDADRSKYEILGLKPDAFQSVELWAPPRRGDRTAAPDVATRPTGVTSYFWTLQEFCHGNLLPFLFTDAEDDRQQYTIVIQNVAARLRDAEPLGEGGVKIEGREVRTFRELIKLLSECVEDDMTRPYWAGPAMGQGTINAFVRRLYGSVQHIEHLVAATSQTPSATPSAKTPSSPLSISTISTTAPSASSSASLSGARSPRKSVRAHPGHSCSSSSTSSTNTRLAKVRVPSKRRCSMSPSADARSASFSSAPSRRPARSSAASSPIPRSASSAGSTPRKPTAMSTDSYPRSTVSGATIMKPGTMILSQPELPIPLVTQFPFPSGTTAQ